MTQQHTECDMKTHRAKILDSAAKWNITTLIFLRLTFFIQAVPLGGIVSSEVLQDIFTS